MNWNSCGRNVKKKADRLPKRLDLEHSHGVLTSQIYVFVPSWRSYETAISAMYILFLHSCQHFLHLKRKIHPPSEEKKNSQYITRIEKFAFFRITQQ